MVHTPLFFWAVMTSPVWLLLLALVVHILISSHDEDLSTRIVMVALYYMGISVTLVGISLLLHLVSGLDARIIYGFWNLVWTSGPGITFWICSLVAALIGAVFTEDPDDVPQTAVNSLITLLIMAGAGYLLFTLMSSAAAIITAQ